MIMAIQAQITVRDMPHSEALDERIRRKIGALQRLDRRIVACKVVVRRFTTTSSEARISRFGWMLSCHTA